MNNISCNVFQDLLPLYIDEVISDDTKLLVRRHLQECPMCRKNYEDMCSKVMIPIDRNTTPLKRIKQTWKRKKITLVCITLIAALVIMISGALAVEEFVYKEQIAYNGSIYTLKRTTVEMLPEQCEKVGYIMGIAHWCTTSPTTDFMATNLDGKYGGCPFYQDPENTTVIYLEDFSGSFIPFHLSKANNK